MVKNIFLFELSLYVCTAKPRISANSLLKTLIYLKYPRGNGLEFTLFSVSQPATGLFYYKNLISFMRNRKEVETIANNSSNTFTLNPTKVDNSKFSKQSNVSSILDEFFNMQNAEQPSDELFHLYQSFLADEEVTPLAKSNALFSIQQIIKLINRLESVNNIVTPKMKTA